jgi:hypothetical protein
VDDAHDDGSRAALSQAAGGDGGATGAPPDDEAQRYRILSRLGEGGMGEVFVAWDTRLQREVALKRLRGRSDASERRLLDEAALTASLDHPGIVPVYDVLRTASGELSYTMRLVRGRTLRVVLKAPPTMATTTTGAVRLDLVRGLADAAVAVGHAHVRGVLHGDLKPDNILIDDAGHAHVADWGLARRLGDAPVGDGAGTIGYLAPEQRDRGALSPATDVWCLGVILVEVLGGAIDAQGLPTLPASTPAPRASIVARATAPSPSARYGDAAAFAADLRAFLARDVVVAHREHPLERLARVARRARALFTLASAAVVLIAVVIVVATLNLRAERDAARASAREARLERHRANVALARALLVEAFTALEDDRDHDAAVLRDRISALLAARPDDEGRADDVDDDEASVRRDARGLGLALAPVAGAATFSPLPGLADCDVLAPRDGRVALVACRVGAQTSVRAVLPEVKERARVDVAAVAAGFGADRVVLRDGDGALSIVTLDGGGVVSIGRGRCRRGLPRHRRRRRHLDEPGPPAPGGWRRPHHPAQCLRPRRHRRRRAGCVLRRPRGPLAVRLWDHRAGGARRSRRADGGHPRQRCRRRGPRGRAPDDAGDARRRRQPVPRHAARRPLATHDGPHPRAPRAARRPRRHHRHHDPRRQTGGAAGRVRHPRRAPPVARRARAPRRARRRVATDVGAGPLRAPATTTTATTTASTSSSSASTARPACAACSRPRDDCRRRPASAPWPSSATITPSSAVAVAPSSGRSWPGARCAR